MKLQTKTLADTLVIGVDEDRLDAAIAIRFKDRMRELTATPAARVLLDLSQVSFLDSSGLGALVAVLKSLPPPLQLELCGLTPNVEKVMHITRMDTVFRIHSSVHAALLEDLRDAG